MGVRKRVNVVLQDWCGIVPIDTDSLSVVWDDTRNNPNKPHDGVAFQPDGVNDLLNKLVLEFKKPGNERFDVSVLAAGSFKPGEIDTTNDLVDAVIGCPNLPPE
jgi:hypothetical protein